MSKRKSLSRTKLKALSQENRNHIAYRSSKMSSRPDCIFEIHQLWQSGYSRVYSNSCCSSSFEVEIIKISQSSHKMYSNNILNFQECTTILNACTKRSGNLLNSPRYSRKGENMLKWRTELRKLSWRIITSMYLLTNNNDIVIQTREICKRFVSVKEFKQKISVHMKIIL